jgi:hypothetical protein
VKKLKKNEFFLNEPTNYGKGVSYYEELRPLLVRYNPSAAYTMGIDLVSKCGLKAFFNKFKRKGIGSAPATNFTPVYNQEIQVDCAVESNGRELIFLLADMIQSTGY